MENKIDNEHESENEVMDYTVMSKKGIDTSEIPMLEIPDSIQQVISRIEQAQFFRARQDINTQLSDIMQNVHRMIHRYTFDEHMQSGRKISFSEYKKRRINLLEKIAVYANSAEIKEKTLAHILAWLEEWNAILSEMTEIDIDEQHHWVAQIEILPETFKAIESNVKILSRISAFLLEEKKQQGKKKAFRDTLWKSWKERVIKRPATAHALTPNQMISDEFATNTKVSEIQGMLQELIGTAMFNKLENNAIKYISSTMVNLFKALSSLNNEVKAMNLQNNNVYINETSERVKELSLKIIKDLSEENEKLQQKLQDAEEKYEQLIRFKLSPTSALKVLPELSPKSSMVFSMIDTEDNIGNILAKEFENSMDGAQRRETIGSGIKWDSTVSQTTQVETIPDFTERQSPLPKKLQKMPFKAITEDKTSLKKGDVYQKDGTDQYQSQKVKGTKGPEEYETSRSNLSDHKGKQTVLETKSDYHFELQALGKKSKEIKFLSEAKSKSFTESKSQHIPADFLSTDSKSQGGKSGTSSKRKVKPEYILEKSQISSERMDKEKSDMSIQAEPFRSIQLDNFPEKVKRKEKKHEISPETTTSKERKTEEKDVSVFTKKFKSDELAESQSKKTKETSESSKVLGSPDGQSEQSNLEEFHKAIMSFLKEKIDNTGNALDKKTVPEEELLSKKAEVEKLGVIKAKMEEYFQNVAGIVTKILRKYKDIKSVGKVGEKPMKQKKVVSFMPVHVQKPISAESEISSLILSESTDPVIHNLTQMILTEIESETDAPVASIAGRDHKEKEKQRQEEYLLEVQKKSFDMNRKHQLKEESYLRKIDEMVNKNLEKEKAWLQMEQQKPNQWQEILWKEQQKQRLQKQIEQDVRQKGTKEEEEQQKQKQQHLEAWRQKMKEQGVSLEGEKGLQKVQKEVKRLELVSSQKEEERQKPMREKQMKTKAEELENVLSSDSMTLLPRWKNVWKDASYLHKRKELRANLADEEEHSTPVTPSTSTQPASPGPFSISGQSSTQSIAITLTPQQAQAQGITLTPQQSQAQGVTLTPQQAQAQGITLTPQQSQAQGVTLTPQQSQAQGVTLTPQQSQAQGVTLTPQQSQAQGVTLTPQQSQAQGVTLTPQQSQAQGVTLTPQQSQAQGVTLTPQQSQAQGVTLTPQQSQAQGVTLTPQQSQAQGVTLTPQQSQAQGVTLTPQQSQAQGVTLTPQQSQAQGVTLTPQQSQAQGVTLTPQQAQAQGITLTPQQSQAQGITLTPQQAQAQGITLTPQQSQAQGVTLTPQQAQAQGTTLTPQQAQAQGVTLTPQQAQALGITLTPQQSQAQGVTLTPQQAQAQGITLTPQQSQAQGVTLTPQQAQALGITLTPQQAQAQVITLTPQQAQAQVITLTPQQAQAQVITLTPQQAQAQVITLTPQQAQAQGITLTPQQAQAQGITVIPELAKELGIHFTPEQSQALGVTVIPQQAQAQGISLIPQQDRALGTTVTPQQAQTQGITIIPEQAQALGITLSPQQAQAQGITLFPQQSQAQGVTLTPQQSQALGITLTPQQAQAQAQAQGITLSPKQAQAQGITVTPEQAQAQGITLSPQQAQAQAQGITLSPKQPQAQGITVTPEQAQAQGITLSSQQAQAQAQDITVTPQQAQAQGITLSPQQAQAQDITLTPEQFKALLVTVTSEKFQGLGVTLSHEQVQALRAPVILQQDWTLGAPITPNQDQSWAMQIPVTTEQAQIFGVPITQGQDEASGVTTIPQQTEALHDALPEQPQELAFTLTPEEAQIWDITRTSEQAPAVGITLIPKQVQLLGAPFTPRQAQPMGITPMSKQGLKSRAGPSSGHTLEAGIFSITDKPIKPSAPHIPKQSPTLVPSTLKPLQDSKTSLPSGQSITSRTMWSLDSSAPIAEKSPIFEDPSTPLQISRPHLSQTPFIPGKSLVIGIPSDPRKLLTPQTFPPSRETLVSKGESTSVQFLASEVPPTPKKLPISGAPPTPGEPLISGVTPISSQIASLWDPLSPRKPLVSGASPIPGELMESGFLTLSEQPQAFQLPDTCEQSPYLQAPSTLGQLLAPRALPGQAFPLWNSPTPGHPPILSAPSAPGKPQKDLSSSASKKSKERLAIISSLKSKSAFVDPSAPNFKVPQAPFTTKKLQISEVSDTSEEIQILHNSFAMEQFRTFQSYLTNYRTPISQTPYIDEGALPTLMKTITSLPSLTTKLPKRSQISPSEWDWKSRFPPINKPCLLTSVSDTKKPKIMVPPSSSQEPQEQKYFVDVKAQRKNLILLNQTTKTSGLPSELHTTAINLIIETLHTDTVRLGYLFRKYIAYRLIQRARNNIIKQLQAIQNSGKGYEIQNLYRMLCRIDEYQKKVLGTWTKKQKSLEQKRNWCLGKMMSLFSQLQEMYKLNLSQPLIIDRKQKPAPTKLVQWPFLELPIKEERKSDIFKKFRQEDQMEAIWNADQSTSSYPITEKTSIHSLWAQLGGYPPIPMLLQLDVQSTFRKSLASIQSQ
ncbi:PREDICTED: protein FAM186A [Miniopterus natalensis]|uniref:protein FAM186A n=1 Tax=Miniopterus natalensis TaxID=291302 RepID=UPI0007A6CB76|nr:PREDICTED: protein FAM186A [Miniopterus natalensis]